MDKDICVERTKEIKGFPVWSWEYSSAAMCWPNLHKALVLIPSIAITITTTIIVMVMRVLSQDWAAECAAPSSIPLLWLAHSIVLPSFCSNLEGKAS